jgi:hypothetical protein
MSCVRLKVRRLLPFFGAVLGFFSSRLGMRKSGTTIVSKTKRTRLKGIESLGFDLSKLAFEVHVKSRRDRHNDG